jgi:hypothetical protein
MTETHELYGPAAQYSEHRQGELISYWCQQDWDNEPKIYTGEILWVCAPTQERGVLYVVAPSTPTGWVDHVYPSEIVIDK